MTNNNTKSQNLRDSFENEPDNGDELEMSKMSSRLPSLSGVRYEATFSSLENVMELMNQTRDFVFNRPIRSESDVGIQVTIQNAPNQENKSNQTRYAKVVKI